VSERETDSNQQEIKMKHTKKMLENNPQYWLETQGILAYYESDCGEEVLYPFQEEEFSSRREEIEKVLLEKWGLVIVDDYLVEKDGE